MTSTVPESEKRVKNKSEHKESEHNNNKKGVIVFFLSTYLHQVRHRCVVGDGQECDGGDIVSALVFIAEFAAAALIFFHEFDT